MRKNQLTGNYEFRALVEEDIGKIHEFQNSNSGFEMSWLLDFDIDWIPQTFEKVKEKIDEVQKNDNNHIFAVSRDNENIGLVVLYSEWDPLCPGIQVFIWPEFRRRGYGSAVADFFLNRFFNFYHGHKVSAGSASYYEGGLKFIESLGFKPAGRMRRTSIYNGKYADWVVYDILKKEFNDSRRSF